MKSLGRSRSFRGNISPLPADSPSKEREPFCLGPFRQKSFGLPSTPTRTHTRSRANGENVPPDNSGHNIATNAYLKANTPNSDSASPAQPRSSRKLRNGGATPLPGSPALLPRPPSARPSPTAAVKSEQPTVQDGTGQAKRKLHWDGASQTAETERSTVTADSGGPDSGVKVIVRVRPLNRKEAAEEATQMVQKISEDVVALGDQHFTYDAVAGDCASQPELFEMVGLPMVENCLAGFNSSIFAYGQTGSGKTHTMMGIATDPDSSTPPSEERGLTPRVFERLFARMQQEEKANIDKELRYQCRCSFLEIYNEQITDLLEPSLKNLQIREDIKTGVYVDSLSEEFVSNVDDVTRLLLKGLTNRKTGGTVMNNESSRSHSVFTCVIESRFKNLAEGGNSVRSSRMNLVDLAGSERQKQTGAAGERLKEAGNINRSLSQLGNVINILAEVAQTGRQRHIPYRDSRLTFLLQESLGGNAKLAMICAVSPASSCRSETLSTLRFAQRAKAIQNKAIVNEETGDDVGLLREQIRQLKDELMRMKSASGNQKAGAGSYSNGWNARRSYNLLRLSLSHPMTTLTPDSEDVDFEMEIVDDDPEPMSENLGSRSAGKEANKDAVPKLPAIDERDGLLEDITMEIEDSNSPIITKSNGNIEGSSIVSSAVVENNTCDQVGVRHSPIRATRQAENKPSSLPSIDDGDDDLVNMGFENSPLPDLVKTPEVSRIPELNIPRALHSPPLSVSPRFRGSSRKAISGSPLAPGPELAAGSDVPPSSSVCDEVYHSTQERFCDGTSTSQSLQLKSSVQFQSNGNVRASMSTARPTEKLAACLQRGLQILDNQQQKNSMACFRRSTAAALRFSIQGSEMQLPKFVDKVEKGIQTSPIALVTTSTSPLPLRCSDVELSLSVPETQNSPDIDGHGKFEKEDNQLQQTSCVEVLQDLVFNLEEGLHSHSEGDLSTSPESRGLWDMPTEQPCLDEHPSSSYHTPASVTSRNDKSEDMSQWQMVALNASKIPTLAPEEIRPNNSSSLQLAQAVESLLTGAIRRERVAEEAMSDQAAEIEQLNRLVRQYKHERECNAILHQTREDKIARLEALMDNSIPTDAFLNEEWSALLLEHKLLQDKFDNHPEVTLSRVEQQRLLDELNRYRNFFDMGEREILLEEVKELRNQISSLLERCGTAAVAGGTITSARLQRLSVARMSLHTTKLEEAATNGPSPASQALLPIPQQTKDSEDLSMVVMGAEETSERQDGVLNSVVEPAPPRSRKDMRGEEEQRRFDWAEEKREIELDWEERERDWMGVLEELREEAESYKRQAERKKQEVDCEKRCSEEMQDALQMAMTGHARLLEQYAELQEKHISLLAKHRKIKEGTADVKKMAKKAGITSSESRWLEAQAVQISALKVESEEERQRFKEESESLQTQLRDTAEAVQAAGELLVRLKEAEESVIVAQDAVAIAEQDSTGLRRDMEKLRRRHATEVATLQQRLLESRLQKTAVCPMCVMAERVKFQFTEVDPETAQTLLEAEARAMALKEEQEWMALQKKTVGVDNLSQPQDFEDELVWMGEIEQRDGEEELHLDEFDDIDHLFSHTS